MVEIFKHKCIKPSCPNIYEDSDPDAYYCQSCNVAKKIIADQINSKFAGLPNVPVESELQKYDRLKDASGFVNFKML